jgi:hypothetical protein
LRKRRGDLPASLCRFIHRLLEKRAHRRFADPAAALRALRSPPREMAAPLVAIGALLALVALLVTFAIFHWQPIPATATPEASEPPAAAAPGANGNGSELTTAFLTLQRELSAVRQAMPSATPEQRLDLVQRLEHLEASLTDLDQVMERLLEAVPAGR